MAMPRHLALTCLIVLSWLTSPIALGQSLPIQLTGPQPLMRLLDLAAQRRGIVLEYGANDVRGSIEITVRSPDGLTDDELWLLVNRQLLANGLATVIPSGGEGVVVTKLSDARAVARVEDDAVFAVSPMQAGFRVVRWVPEFVPAQEASESITASLGRQLGALAITGSPDSVVFAGPAWKIQEALALGQAFDVRGAKFELQRYPLKTVDPVVAKIRLDALLQSLEAQGGASMRPRGTILALSQLPEVWVSAPESEADRWEAVIEMIDRAEPLERVVYDPNGFPIDEVAQLLRDALPSGGASAAVVVTPNRLTDSILVTAPPSIHALLAQTIQRLADLPAEARRVTEKIELTNRKAEDIERLLTQLTNGGVTPTAQDQSPAGSSTAPSREPASRDQDSVTITVDTELNAIVVAGSYDQVEAIRSIIAKLDVRQPQVLLRITVVTLSESDSLDFGIELERLGTEGSTFLRLASLFGLSTRGTSGDVTAGNGSGFTGVALDPGSFSVVVRALKAINDGRTMNEALTVVNAGQPATIDSTTEIPFLSTTDSSTSTTTSQGGTQSAGLQVEVTPILASGDRVQLEYTVSLSSFIGDSADPALSPPRQESSVSSLATIPEGYVAVVGGLEQLSETEAVSMVPLLGEVPILGELFKSRSTSSSRTRFFVFIRPIIDRGDRFELLKHTSDQAITDSAMEDPWPKVTPRIIP